MDKGPEKGGEQVKKLRPVPLELASLAHLVPIKNLTNCRPSSWKDGAWNSGPLDMLTDGPT